MRRNGPAAVAAILALAATAAAAVPNVATVRVAAAQADATPARQWGALTRGAYGVGFRLAGEYDHSRRVAAPSDFEGKPNAGPLAMPMQIGVWYPATRVRGAARMPYGVFAALPLKRTDLAPVTPADRAAAMDNVRQFSGFAFGRQMADSVVRVIDTTTTAAVRDAAAAAGRFPVLLAATDGSIAAATVLFEYLASHGIVVIATPSQRSYATLQVSRPAAVVEARVRDLEYVLAHARGYPFVDTTRIAVLGANFDGMAALAFQMKNMAARAVVSLDGWEGKQGTSGTLRSSMHYDTRRLRVPYLVVEQHEQTASPYLTLDRTVFDALAYSDRQWLVLNQMTHAYLIGNPLAYPDVPDERRRAYELLVRGIHRFLAAPLAPEPRALAALVTAEDGDDGRSPLVKEIIRREARPAVPDDAELERLIMVDRAVDKVTRILEEARRADSSFVLFPERTMALYAFRFTRQNDRPFAIRLLALNADAHPRSWTASSALGDGYRDASDTTRAIAAYERALRVIAATPTPNDVLVAEAARNRQAVEEKIAKLRTP